MEVHHHPEIEKKTFKQYVLEGLMIFLAVFMGFIAENIRENYTEHQKARAFAATMLADVKSDTVQLKVYIAYYTLAKANTDTLMNLISSYDIKQIPSGKLYLYGLWGGAQQLFIPDDATFEQMKSTGSLQFFKRSVARQAAEYDQRCRYMLTLDANDQLIYTEVRKLRAQLFEFQYNSAANEIWNQATLNHKHLPDKAGIEKINAFIKTKPPLLSYDKSVFNQYVEMVRSRYFQRKLIVADSVLTLANRLIDGIKKEYPDAE
jgi:hypothetical protein